MKKPDILYLFTVLLILAGTLNFFMISGSFLGYSYDLDYSEGFVVENVEKMMSGQPLYPEIGENSGFRSVKYPPVYYFFMAFTSSIFGLGFFSGRIISFLSALGVVAAIHLITREESSRKAYILPLLFLVPYLTVFTATTVRTDMLGLLFVLMGLYFFRQDRDIASSTLFLLAFFTKQTFVAGFAACSLGMLYSRRKEILEMVKRQEFYDFNSVYSRFERFVNFNAVFGFGVLAGFLALYLWQPNVFANIFAANLGGFQVRWELISWLHFAFLPIFAGTVYGLYIMRDQVLSLYFGFSLVIMLLQLTRGGAWVHAAIEPFAVSVLVVTLVYGRYSLTRKHLELLLVAQLALFFTAPMVSGNLSDINQLTEFNSESDSEIREYVKSNDRVYVEHIGYEFGTTGDYSPEIWGMYELYESGRITGEEVQDFFSRKNYTHIITYKRLENLPLERYLEENYEVVDTVERKDMILNTEKWRVYRWKR